MTFNGISLNSYRFKICRENVGKNMEESYICSNQKNTHMPKIKFFIRTTNKKDPANIYVRFIDGRQIDLTAKTNLIVLPENWSNEAQNVRNKASFTDKDDFRTKLKKLRRFIEDKHNADANRSKEWLKLTIDQFHHPDKYKEKKITLFIFIEDFISNAETRINLKTGRPISIRTRQKYSRTFDLLKEYAEASKSEPDFQDIDLNFYQRFTDHMRQVEEMATNTIGKYIKTLKVFLNESVESGLNTNLAFKSQRFSAISEESDSIYLNVTEIGEIEKLDLTKISRLDTVRDLFLIGCWTGLRFGDVSTFSETNINDKFIYITPQKTEDKKIVIPIHPVVQKIFSKYEGKLPKNISNQNFNKYIKEIAELAKLNDTVFKTITKGGVKETSQYEKWELVSSHTARRSFATNLYKSGFPSISIMKITGHQTEKAFLKYIKVTPEEHAKLLENHWKQSGLIPNL